MPAKPTRVRGVVTHPNAADATPDQPIAPAAPSSSFSTWGGGMILVLALGILAAFWIAGRSAVDSAALKLTMSAAVLVLPALVAGLAGWALRGQNDIGSRTARGWGLVGAGSLAGAAWMALATLPEVFGVAIPSMQLVSGIMYGAMMVLFVAGLVSWVRRLTPAATAGAVIDIFAVGLLGYLVVSTLVSNGNVESLGGAAGQVLLLMHPIADIIVLLGAVAVLSQIGRHEMRGAEILGTFGIIAVLASDMWMSWIASESGQSLAATLQQIAGGSVTGTFADLGTVIGFLAIAGGATIRRRMLDTEALSPLVERSTTWEVIWTVVPFAMLAAAMAISRTALDADGIARSIYLVIVGLLMLRCALVAVTNLQRARQLDTDPLTGAFNHTRLQAMLALQTDKALASGEPLSLIMIDVDDFSLINDGFSHSEGDRYLRELVHTLRPLLDEGHVLFRPGGDELAVMLPQTSTAAAVDIARTIEIAADAIRVAGGAAPTLTMGIATLPDHAQDAHDLLNLADGTLYWGKLNGKRSVTAYDPATVTVMNADERVRIVEQNSRLRAVLALARALDARDPSTARHSQNVARYAVVIAAELGWSPDRQQLLRVAGMLHDVGKIGVRDSTLRKTFALTAEEQAEMRRHPELGAQLITGVAPDEVVGWVLSHHERWDGRGYPHGAAATDIPDGARILAVADSFDAMTSSRSYRPGMSVTWVIGELARCAGEQFDAEVVGAFLRALASGSMQVLADAGVDHGTEHAAQPITAPIAAPVEPEFAPVETSIPVARPYLDTLHADDPDDLQAAA